MQQEVQARCERKANLDQLNASDVKKLGDGILSGNDPMQPQIDSLKTGSVVSMSNLDQSGWLGGGSCFQDKTFSILGQSVTIQFSQACNALIALRYAVMIIAALVSFRILSGAVIRE